jgi:GTP cyclohydrolase II
MYARCDEAPAPGWGKIDCMALQSKQAPRHVRLAEQTSKAPLKGRRSSTTGDRVNLSKTLRPTSNALQPLPDQAAPLQMVCHARTRVPTPHGDVFLHVYKNNRDAKEHLAFVFDRNQLACDVSRLPESANPSWIRSKSLDAQWKPDETAQERIVRGAYVGRLTPQQGEASSSAMACHATEPTLVRIHSECFTGETIGSQRCDCGEQLDEAFRLISTCPAGKGVVVYLRQEGRGIGLLEKVRAYNLQDLGHDTVSANLLLGHASDSRTYDLAAGILRDLGIDSVKLLTNNPDKVAQAESEGIRVIERVPMVPRSWRQISDRTDRRHVRKSKSKLKRKLAMTAKGHRKASSLSTAGGDYSDSVGFTTETESEDDNEAMQRDAGVGMIGGSTTESSELEKYLRTKVERMGHMLAVPPSAPATPLTQPSTPDVQTDSEQTSFFRQRFLASKERKRTKQSLADSWTEMSTCVAELAIDVG